MDHWNLKWDEHKLSISITLRVKHFQLFIMNQLTEIYFTELHFHRNPPFPKIASGAHAYSSTYDHPHLRVKS